MAVFKNSLDVKQKIVKSLEKNALSATTPTTRPTCGHGLKRFYVAELFGNLKV